MEGNIWMEIRAEYKKGLSYAEIGRKHNIDARTAKKYALAEIKPVYELCEPKPSKLDHINSRRTYGLKKRRTARFGYMKSC